MESGFVRGGMWAALDDRSRINLKVKPADRHGEITFFGSFEVSLGMTEEAMIKCRDLLSDALRDMHEEQTERSWMRPAAPTD
ncbi:hypothetical protein [Lentzea sp. E54]|uniref:hypothetical protein n=1 Tax=Lentzea xerophila TaxID=3435883 RepID=UPI003DA5D6FA